MTVSNGSDVDAAIAALIATLLSAHQNLQRLLWSMQIEKVDDRSVSVPDSAEIFTDVPDRYPY